jgi:hypothetical protein
MSVGVSGEPRIRLIADPGAYGCAVLAVGNPLPRGVGRQLPPAGVQVDQLRQGVRSEGLQGIGALEIAILQWGLMDLGDETVLV